MGWNIELGEQFDTIGNESIRITTHRVGAELISLQINHPQKGWTGILVNDNEMAPTHDYWKKHAPFLFPIVGGLINGTSKTTSGQTVSLPNHGFARVSLFERVDHGSDLDSAWLEYLLAFEPNDTFGYPWACSLSIRYVLSGTRLDTIVTILNNSDSTMWYQFGWHPGFKAPLSGDHSKRDSVLIGFPEGNYQQLEVNEECQLTGKTKEFHISDNLTLTQSQLHETFILDMSNNSPRYVSLYDPESAIKTTVSFDDYPQLGLWALPDAPYICIEPWQGCDDYADQTPFDKKCGIASLAPNEADYRTIATIIEY